MILPKAISSIRMVSVLRWALPFSMLFMGACKTQENKASQINMNEYVMRSTQLMVTRGTNGTTLAWESKSNEMYTVKIRDGHYQDSRWINHPKLVNIQGTGGRITYRDNPGPTEKRKYSLQVTRLDGSGPRAPKRSNF